MKAEQMFEELGYRRTYHSKSHIIYRNDDTETVIEFMLLSRHKQYFCGVDLIELKLHQAIHQQLIDLGWITT